MMLLLNGSFLTLCIVWSAVPLVKKIMVKITGELFSSKDPGDNNMKMINKKRFSRSSNIVLTNRACMQLVLALSKTAYAIGLKLGELVKLHSFTVWQRPHVHNFTFECRKVRVWTMKNEHLKT